MKEGMQPSTNTSDRRTFREEGGSSMRAFLPGKITNEGREIQLLPEQFVSVVIPYRNLYGIQLPTEYQHEKAKRVRQIYSQKGPSFLEEEPGIACALGCSENVVVALLDGHNRTRYAPEKIKRYGAPTIVITKEIAAKLFSTSADVESFEQYVLRSAFETIHEFSKLYARDNKMYIPPQPLTGPAAAELWDQLYGHK